MEQPTNSKKCRTGRSKSSSVGSGPSFPFDGAFRTRRPAGYSQNRAGCLHRAAHQNVRTRTDHGRPARAAITRLAPVLWTAGRCAESEPSVAADASARPASGRQQPSTRRVKPAERARALDQMRCWTRNGSLVSKGVRTPVLDMPGGTCGPIGAKLCTPARVSDLNQHENIVKL